MISTKLLVPGDELVALDLFELLSRVFETPGRRLELERARTLLASPAFLAVAAFSEGELCGGATGHILPMTREPTSELFIYDIAVDERQQRRGIGRQLIECILAEAATLGVTVAFVPADNEDDHALAFYENIGGTGAPVTIFTFER